MIILRYFIPCLVLSLGTGGLAGALIAGKTHFYDLLDKPPLAPPGMLFPIVWTVLYILIGIAHYMIHISYSSGRREAIKLYYVQLALNFLWPILFFRLRTIFLSVLCVIALLVVTWKTIKSFYKIKPAAGKLLAVYGAWIAFATYLNIGVWLLN